MNDDGEQRAREVSVGTDSTHAVVLRRTYRAPIEDVWDACTDPDRVQRWFLPISGDLREGGRFQLEGNAGGTIERCEPPRLVRATWEFGGAVSRLFLRLRATDDEITILELEHTVPDDDHWRQFGPGAVGIGWDLGLRGLGEHLSGAPIDRAAGASWMASDDGRRFMAHSGAAWRDAHLASGVPAPVAEAAAEQTLRAYTGS